LGYSNQSLLPSLTCATIARSRKSVNGSTFPSRQSAVQYRPSLCSSLRRPVLLSRLPMTWIRKPGAEMPRATRPCAAANHIAGRHGGRTGRHRRPDRGATHRRRPGPLPPGPQAGPGRRAGRLPGRPFVGAVATRMLPGQCYGALPCYFPPRGRGSARCAGHGTSRRAPRTTAAIATSANSVTQPPAGTRVSQAS
jgi:hypothetical protein